MMHSVSDGGDRQEWRYLVPTICDELPPTRRVEPLGTGSGAFELHADDWRQIEFVAHHAEQVEVLLDGVRSVLAFSTGRPGFEEVVVREGLAEPLRGTTLRMRDLRRVLRDADEHEALSFVEQRGTVTGGFAFRADSFVVYGRARFGRIRALGLHRVTPRLSATSLDAEVVAWAAAQDLMLVDWCGATTATEAEGMLAFLAS